MMKFKTIGLGVVFGAILGTAYAEERPNILWITLEDTSTQFIGAYGNKQVKTPAIDKLAAEGVRFTSAFAPASVCSAARSSIITGVDPVVIGTGHHRSSYPLPDSIKGFPAYLREAGYYTTNKSKTDYNTSDEARVKKESWDMCSGKADWSRRAKGQPFFCVFNFMDSHQSRTMTDSWGSYVNRVLKKLPEEDRTDPEGMELPTFYLDSPEMRKHMSRVYNSLNYTDIKVAKLLGQLEEDGLRDDTIIFLYADHGEGMPNMKGGSIGMSFRVPFIVWFPEKYQHLNPWGMEVVTDELVTFEDLAPTLLSIAGIEVPEYMTGRALLGESREEAPEFVFAGRHRCGEGLDTVRSVTDGRYFYSRVFMPQLPALKLHQYFDVADISKTMRKDYAAQKLNEEQARMFKPRAIEYLIDLRKDRWERKNLAGDPAHQEQLERMRQAVLDRALEVNDVHFMPEYVIDRVTEKTTLYEVRGSDRVYPLDRILPVANLVGQGQAVIEQQIGHLQDPHPIIRYWAAVGLHAQGEAMLSHQEVLLKALDDDQPYVRLEVAALAWKLNQMPEAKKVYEATFESDDFYAVWQAIQSMLYMNDEQVDELMPYVDSMRKRIKGQKKHPLNGGLVKSSLSMLDYRNKLAQL